MNFDRASKGNPGPGGFGSVIRDNAGKMKCLKAGFLGHDTNNLVELWGPIKGLQLYLSLNLNPLIAEGYSKMIISLAKKFIQGLDPKKITPNWRLIGPLSLLQASLLPPITIIPSHIKREANKVVD